MPRVAGRKFPYTPKGKADAAKAKEKMPAKFLKNRKSKKC